MLDTCFGKHTEPQKRRSDISLECSNARLPLPQMHRFEIVSARAADLKVGKIEFELASKHPKKAG